MKRISLDFIIMTGALVGFLNTTIADELESAQTVLRDSLRSVSNIRLLSKSYPTGDIQSKQVLSDFALVMKRLKEDRNQLFKIEENALKDFEAKFRNMHTYQNLSWRVAERGKPFLDELPEYIVVRSDQQIVTIRKVGGRLSYAVCPEVCLEDGDRASLTLSLPLPSVQRATPVPWFGIRDSTGREIVLCSLGPLNGDGKKHSILVQNIGNEGLAILDGQLAWMHMKLPMKGLTSPVYMFIHMNDVSEVKVHSIQFSRAPEKKSTTNE